MPPIRFAQLCVLACVLSACSLTCVGQAVTGTPPFGSFAGGPDIINLGNLNVHLSIPVFNKAGRGIPFSYNLSSDSSIYYPSNTSGILAWTPVFNWGWSSQTAGNSGYISNTSTTVDCYYTQNKVKLIGSIHSWTTNYVYHDPWGVSHPFVGTANVWAGNGDGGCTLGTDNGFIYTTQDGSGYTIAVASPGATTITTKGGVVLTPPINIQSGSANSTDSNGNEITVSSSGVFTDSLGTTALTIAGAAPNPTTFTYSPPSGPGAVYKMIYAPNNIQTEFGCPGVAEYSATGVYLVSEIDLPDESVYPNDKYTFQYEKSTTGNVTGRLASVTLPTGGTISYTYNGTNNGIECGDGSTSGFQRSTPDTGAGVWTYSRSNVTGTEWTTTIRTQTHLQIRQLLRFRARSQPGLHRISFWRQKEPSIRARLPELCYRPSTPATTPPLFPVTQPRSSSLSETSRITSHGPVDWRVKLLFNTMPTVFPLRNTTTATETVHQDR